MAEGPEQPGAAIPPAELGSILNSSVSESLRKQRERGVDLRNMVFDVARVGGHPVDPEQTPYEERRRMLEEILPHLPGYEEGKFHLPEETQDPEEAKQLWRRIQAGEHPLTREGVVVHPPQGRPRKAKGFTEADVYITGTFPGQGRRADTIGGLRYATEPGGPERGRVGTGFDEQTLRDLAAIQDELPGRVARIQAQEQLPSGAYRAPSFVALHEDIAPQDTQKQAADRPPVVAVDLDGTLAQPYGEFDPNHIPPPRVGARKWMKRFQEIGAHIVIFTVRGEEQVVKDWLREHDIPFTYVNDNPNQPDGTSDKVMADVYIDDKGVRANPGKPWSQIGEEAVRELEKAAFSLDASCNAARWLNRTQRPGL